MDFFKKLLTSKTIQGVFITVGGALVKFADTSYPEYAILINSVASALISGGAVRAVMGRIVAQGPIVADPPAAGGSSSAGEVGLGAKK